MSRLYISLWLFKLIIWNTRLDEAQGEIKISGRNINNLRYACDITLMAESEEDLKTLLMKVSEESEKFGLKLNIQGFLYFCTNCGIICFGSLKNTDDSLIGSTLNLLITLGSILVFTILILLIHEHGIFLPLFVSSFISFISAL